ncbi:MAG: ribonuclease III [Clostridiales bacterium]|nr:ribonuclease III [Clostridiales bacterium]
MENNPIQQRQEELAAQLSFKGEDWLFLRQALTHPTFFEGNKLKDQEDNQRLEFLGDAVLDLLVGELLFQLYPKAQEGQLTKMRAAIVSENPLAKKAEELGLGEALLLGKGGEANGDRHRPSVLADTFEAVLGALYCHLGLAAAKKFIADCFAADIAALTEMDYEDNKSILQELVQREGDLGVHYRLHSTSGPDHAPEFLSGVYWGDKLLATGQGSSKKESEQTAAKQALQKQRQWLRV